MPRIEEPLEFARRTRVLLLRHANYVIDIDVILGRLPFEEDVVARAQVGWPGAWGFVESARMRLP